MNRESIFYRKAAESTWFVARSVAVPPDACTVSRSPVTCFSAVSLPLALMAVGTISCSGEAPESVPALETACQPTSGNLCTWAGTGTAGFNGDGLHRLDSKFYLPFDIEFAPDGPPYITDWNNHRVRRVAPDETVTTVIGTGGIGSEDPASLGEGLPGTEFNTHYPTHVTFSEAGDLLLAAWHNSAVLKWSPDTGLVTMLCGLGEGFAGDGGPANLARFDLISDIEFDALGNLLIVDQGNQRLRLVDGLTLVVETVVGTGEKGYNGDSLPLLETQLNFGAGTLPEPSSGLARDRDGNFYLTDNESHRVRKISLATGMISTLVGTGVPGYGGDGGPGSDALLNSPRDVEIGPDGNLYIADTLNHRIRRVILATGTIETIAGTGTGAYSGDSGPALEAELYRPYGLGFDSNGSLYIADTFNHRIRVLYF